MVRLVEQELLTYWSTKVHSHFSGVRAQYLVRYNWNIVEIGVKHHNPQSFVFCVIFSRPLLSLCFLAILLSVLVQITTSDYYFGIFKLLLFNTHQFEFFIDQ